CSAPSISHLRSAELRNNHYLAGTPGNGFSDSFGNKKVNWISLRTGNNDQSFYKLLIELCESQWPSQMHNSHRQTGRRTRKRVQRRCCRSLTARSRSFRVTSPQKVSHK